MIERAEEYDALYMCIRLTLRATVMGETFTVSGYVAEQAIYTSPDYKEHMYEVLQKELEITVGKWVLAQGASYTPHPQYSKHASDPAMDVTGGILKEIYQQKIAEQLKGQSELLKYIKGPPKPPEPSYEEKAVSEFEGVDDLDDELWNEDGEGSGFV